MDNMKRCPMCGDVKPLSSFGRNRRRHDGVSVYCRPCKSQEQRQRWARRPAHYNAQNRKSRLKRRYGLRPETLWMMKALRSGRCDCCGRVETLHVDHDHVTGAVRGLLCGSCNRAIGLLGDNAAGVARAAAYLQRLSRPGLELEQAVLSGRAR
jgi:hypothetical protein